MRTERLLLVLATALLAGTGQGADWPMWRYDAGHSGASPEPLPRDLRLQWVRQMPPPRPAWPDEPRLAFDWTYEPIAAGGRLFVPSSADDRLTALDADTGEELWRFFADGPVRFPAAAWQDRVYFVSDDGFLYCLDAAKGELLWKCRGGPSDRRMLGNGRLISAWPARGGPVAAEGKIYFAAGIWPSMGVFVHCLDALSGRILWTNDASGSLEAEQPHGGIVPSGVSPQGTLTFAGDKLLVPCGRTHPAVFVARDGRLLAYQMGHRDEVGSQVVAADGYFFSGAACSLDAKGRFEILHHGGYRLPVVRGNLLVHATCGPNESPVPPAFAARLLFPPSRAGDASAVVTEARDLALGKWIEEPAAGTKRRVFVFPLTWRMPGFHVAIQAGGRLYGTIGTEVAAVDPPAPGGAPQVVWRGKVEGQPLSMLAAAGKLFVVTAEGAISCFGGKPSRVIAHRPVSISLDAAPDRRVQTARRLAGIVGQEPGFGVVLGLDGGRLAEELVRQTHLEIVAIDPDPKKIDALRRRWLAAGQYGNRLAAIAADPCRVSLPPHLARLVVSENPVSAGFRPSGPLVRSLVETLRPLGGMACLPMDRAQEAHLKELIDSLRLPGASLARDGDWVVLKRGGPLAGSADWTHEFADAANTRMSPDERVQGPFEVLWFGGPLANRLMYPKQVVPPTPPIVDGRMFLQGPGAIRAVDIYTGTVLWTHRFEDDKEDRSLTYDKGDLRVTYRSPAGRNGDYARIKRVGYHCAAAHDAVYLACGRDCLGLDPATGKVRSRFQATGDDGRTLFWDSIRVCDDLLVATAVSPGVPLAAGGFSREEIGGQRREFRAEWVRNLEAAPADYLIAAGRRTGKVLWRRRARQAFLGTQQFWHLWGSQSYQDTSVAAGGDKVFCLDMLPDDLLAAIQRRGFQPSGGPQLLALEARSGKVLWETPAPRYISLAYSQEHEVLVTADAKHANWGQGFVGDEIVARRGADGAVLWRARGVDGPVILHHRTIYGCAASFSNGAAFDLLTGERKTSPHPLTGEPIPWRCPRAHGCNVPIGGERLLAFRSATAAYYDLTTESGTVALGGFRAGCSNTLIPAGGILNAPNYAYGCVCNFQNDTSLALVHGPEAEAWAWTALPPITRPVRRLGLNFGAPGDRRADDGTLWLACTRGLDGPVRVRVEPQPSSIFRWHPSRVSGDGPRWVAASGIDGVRRVSIDLSPAEGPPIRYSVALVLIEPQSAAPGERVFDIAIQGRTVAEGIDIAAQTGRERCAVLRKFNQMDVRRQLEIIFTARPGAKLPCAALCGVEIQREN